MFLDEYKFYVENVCYFVKVSSNLTKKKVLLFVFFVIYVSKNKVRLLLNSVISKNFFLNLFYCYMQLKVVKLITILNNFRNKY